MKTILLFLLSFCIANYLNAQSASPVPVQVGNKWGYANSSGKLVIAPAYSEAGPFEGDPSVKAENRVAIVKQGENSFAINSKGVRLSPLNFVNTVFDYYENTNFFYTTNKAGKVGVFKNLKEIIPPTFDNIEGRYNGFIVIRNNKKGFMDFNGKMIIPVQYDEISQNYELSDKKWSVLEAWNVDNEKSKTQFKKPAPDPKYYTRPILIGDSDIKEDN